MTLSVVRSVGTLDRTGVVQTTLARIGAERFEELDVARPVDLDACAVDVDVLLVGAKELSATGLRRIARWRRDHPVSVAVAHLNGGTVDKAALSGAGIAQSVRGPLTAAKLRAALERADAALWDLLDAAERHGFAADHRGEPEPLDDVDVDVELVIDAADSEPGADDSTDWDPEPEPEAEQEAFDEEPASVEADVPATERPVGRPDGRIVTIASATGGCGKTFFATSTATVLARMGHRVLLVDLDLQFGEVAAALQVHHPYSIYDGLYRANGQRLEAEEFEVHLPDLVCHHELGFDVLTAPRDPALADYVGARDAGVVLDAVAPRYDVVLVDTPPSLNDVVIAALDRSDLVEVLATPDVPSLRNLTAFTDVLRRLGLEDERLRLILNKVEPDVGVTVAQANEAFGGRFRTILPADRAVSRAVNRGTTAPAHEPRSKIARAIVPAAAGMAAGLALTPRAAAQSSFNQHTHRPRRLWRAFSGGRS